MCAVPILCFIIHYCNVCLSLYAMIQALSRVPTLYAMIQALTCVPTLYTMIQALACVHMCIHCVHCAYTVCYDSGIINI
jgi:hypothetical protein